MIAPVILPVVRRAILDLLTEIGGERSHDAIAMDLRALGHRPLSSTDVAAELLWLAEAGLVKAEPLGHYTVARVLAAGREVAEGQHFVDGVSRHKTGE